MRTDGRHFEQCPAFLRAMFAVVAVLASATSPRAPAVFISPDSPNRLRVMPVLRDERTPFPAKLFLGLAIGYLCMPFDLIPDFIPVIGHLDDAVVIPALVFAALCFVPREIVSEQPRAGHLRTGRHQWQGLNCATTRQFDLSKA